MTDTANASTEDLEQRCLQLQTENEELTKDVAVLVQERTEAVNDSADKGVYIDQLKLAARTDGEHAAAIAGNLRELLTDSLKLLRAAKFDDSHLVVQRIVAELAVA